MMESTEMARKRVLAVEMLPLLKRHEIQVLLRAGLSKTDVATRTGVSVDTVSRVKREDDVVHVDDGSASRRPSSRAPHAAVPGSRGA